MGCTECESYASGWCQKCRDYGVRTQVDSKSQLQLGRNFKSCIKENTPQIPQGCVKPQFRRLEGEDEDEDESSEERVLGSAPIGKFDGSCQSLLTKNNGAAKGGKKAVCTLCTECESYMGGWCQKCRDYGVRTQVDSKSQLQLGRNFKSCIKENTPQIPQGCVKPQFRRLEGEDEDESPEERVLGSAPIGKLDGSCQSLLTKNNGAAKGGKKAVCILCTECESYASGWCQKCRDYGVRTQ